MKPGRLISLLCLLFLVAQCYAERPPQAGTGLVWPVGDVKEILKLPYIHYGQTVTTWKGIEPQEGVFDWTKFDETLKMYHDMGKRVPIQVNSPVPEWIFNYVANMGTSRGGNAPQYWDPVYQEKLKTFINAYAKHVGTSPYKDTVLYARMQFLAINTEILEFGGKYVQGTASPDRKKWILPKNGHVYDVELTDAIRGQMIQQITNMYLEAFGKYNIPVGLRLPAEKMLDDVGLNGQAIFDKWCASPLAWLITTHYSLGLIGSAEQAQWRRRCRELGTTGFMEAFGPISPGAPSKNFDPADLHGKMWGAALPDASGNLKLVELDPQQAFYWQMLLNLDMGGSYISLYGLDALWIKDLPQCLEAVDLINKYAGYQHDPAQSPGAWIALGQFHARGAAAGKAASKNASAPAAKADQNWGWYIKQDNPKPEEAVYNAGPNDDVHGVWARRIKGSATFTLDPAFAESLKDKAGAIEVMWLNEPSADLNLLSNGTPLGTLKTDGSGQWKHQILELNPSAITSGKLEIQPPANGAVIHMIEVLKR